jgi:hypothetical protein
MYGFCCVLQGDKSGQLDINEEEVAVTYFNVIQILNIIFGRGLIRHPNTHHRRYRFSLLL